MRVPLRTARVPPTSWVEQVHYDCWDVPISWRLGERDVQKHTNDEAPVRFALLLLLLAVGVALAAFVVYVQQHVLMPEVRRLDKRHTPMYRFPSPDWDTVTDAAKELINGLLSQDP